MKLSENCLKKYSVSLYGQFRNKYITVKNVYYLSTFSVTLKSVITFKNVRNLIIEILKCIHVNNPWKLWIYGLVRLF